MIDYSSLPEPRERDLGNGIIALDNAYSIFAHGTLLGVEYEPAYRLEDYEPFVTGHVLYVCPQCGNIWARKVLRAFPLWKPTKWNVEVASCDGAMLTLNEEALQQQPLLLQALDAYLHIWTEAPPTCR